MKCVSSVSYSIILNGKGRHRFKPTKGIRQGDPLSLLLFLICSEGLSALMKMGMRDGSVQWAKVSFRGLQISHLLFADNCILFGEISGRGHIYTQDLCWANTRGAQVNMSITKNHPSYLARTLSRVKNNVFPEY